MFYNRSENEPSPDLHSLKMISRTDPVIHIGTKIISRTDPVIPIFFHRNRSHCVSCPSKVGFFSMSTWW